jgi:hypothetical protein
MAAFLLQKGSLVNPPKLDFSDSLNGTVYAPPHLTARGSGLLGHSRPSEAGERSIPTPASTHILPALVAFPSERMLRQYAAAYCRSKALMTPCALAHI